MRLQSCSNSCHSCSSIAVFLRRLLPTTRYQPATDRTRASSRRSEVGSRLYVVMQRPCGRRHKECQSGESNARFRWPSSEPVQPLREPRRWLEFRTASSNWAKKSGRWRWMEERTVVRQNVVQENVALAQPITKASSDAAANAVVVLIVAERIVDWYLDNAAPAGLHKLSRLPPGLSLRSRRAANRSCWFRRRRSSGRLAAN